MSLLEEKQLLIEKLVSVKILQTPEVIRAFRRVRREDFVPEKYRSSAYEDVPLPIGSGQTISQPLTVAAMTEALGVRKGQRILEIGAGSGYQAAILAEITGQKGLVVTLERLKTLYEFAKANLQRSGYASVMVIHADGTLGYEKKAPYDRILVAADAPELPPALPEQLKKGGKMIIPVRGTMTLIEKNQKLRRRELGTYAFVPLIGRHGYTYP